MDVLAAPARRTVRPLALGVLLGGALALVGVTAGCGDGADGAEATAALGSSMGFLRTDFSFSDAQVRCAVRQVEATVDEDDRADFAVRLEGLDSGERAVEDLTDADRRVLLDVVRRCAVEGS